MSWELQTTSRFDKAIKKLDRTAALQVLGALDRIAALEDPRSTGKALTGHLSSYWRYRIGDYWGLAEIQDSRLIIVAVDVGHRSTVYRRA